MKLRNLILGVAAWLMFCGVPAARGQVPPIFGGGAIAFEPEISIINSGVLNDVQGTVSADRKYVTLTMQPQNSNLLALREFSFGQQTNLGPVGIGATPRDAHGVKIPIIQGGQYGAMNPPAPLGAGAGLVLRQRGMTLLVNSSSK